MIDSAALKSERWVPAWWGVLLIGLALWIAAIGVAALESSGYALASLFVVQGHVLSLSLTSVVITELIRGVLAPFGHGMWSALLGAAIFAAAARHGRLRLSRGVLGTYVVIAVLH